MKTICDTCPNCHRAHLSLCIDNKTVNYSWSRKHFEIHANRPQKGIQSDGNSVQTGFNSDQVPSNSDHCYARKSQKSEGDNEEDDDVEDVDYSSIFDADGKWQRSHKRHIIHVLDSFRISHEAYHELRHAGKGHFPPLGAIMKEKIVMSDEIPYVKHPTVSIQIFISNLC